MWRASLVLVLCLVLVPADCMVSQPTKSWLTRRALLEQATLSTAGIATLLLPTAAVAAKEPRPRKLSIDEAREIGEARAAEIEREKGPILKTPEGITYREEVQGQGEPLREGDAAYIQYTVFRINGDYMFSLGKGGELQRDEGAQYRLVLGAAQVPKAVELAIAGMREGGRRKVVVPPSLGWGEQSPQNSLQQPVPGTFSGKRKLELYREQPLMVEVDLQRVVPKNRGSKAQQQQQQQ